MSFKKYGLLQGSQAVLELGVATGQHEPARGMRSPKEYRAEVLGMFIDRRPGNYAHEFLSNRVGVSIRTARNYDKPAGIDVTPNFERETLSQTDIEALPDELPKKRKYNFWLEVEINGKPVKYRGQTKHAPILPRAGVGKIRASCDG